MKGDVYYGKGIRELKDQYPELYELVSDLNETVWDGKILDYKTQKLIAIGITASVQIQELLKNKLKVQLRYWVLVKTKLLMF